MKITLNQQELNQVIQDHLSNQGITLTNKEIHFDYTDGVEITLGQIAKPKRKPKETKPVEAVNFTEEVDTADTEDTTEDLSAEPEETTEEVNEKDDEIPFSKTSRPLFT